jgi:hypothetical protein
MNGIPGPSNSKHEIRNPKQIRITEIEMIETEKNAGWVEQSETQRTVRRAICWVSFHSTQPTPTPHRGIVSVIRVLVIWICFEFLISSLSSEF